MGSSKKFAAILVASFVLIASIVAVIALYPSALEQSNYFVRPSEVHALTRLPSFVTPLSYDINLHPHLDSGIIEGQERIVLQVSQSTSRIALHVHGINITGLNLHVNDAMLTASLHTEHEKHIAYFSFQRPIEPGQCVLEISFRYHMRMESMSGAFVTRRRQRIGSREISPFVGTYLTPTIGGRALFPCFDEPHFKANFTISLVTTPGYTALSSTQPTDITHLIAGGNKVHFAATPPISPHKLAFVIGKLKSIETTTKDGLLLRVWAEEGFQPQSRLALRLALDGVDLLMQKLSIPLPVRKIDLIALPDFVEDMQQSFGLCLFDEGSLIYDIGRSPATDRWRIATSVWQCLCNHWFSDHVTPQDLSHMWLSDALSALFTSDVFSTSSALQILGGSGLTDNGNEDGTIWFEEKNSQQALEVDSMPQSHALMGESFEPRYIFDDIVSRKGASVLSMFRAYMNSQSPFSFENGVRSFLSNSNVSGTMTTSDLLSALDKASGLDVTLLSKAWISSPSYPVLDVSIDKETVTVKQRPYFLFSQTLAQSLSLRSRTYWNIPVTYSNPNMVNGTTLVLLPDVAQTKIVCSDCMQQPITTKNVSVSPQPVIPILEVSNATSSNGSVMFGNTTSDGNTTAPVLSQLANLLGTNVTAPELVDVLSSPLLAPALNETVIRELESAKEQIAALQAENQQAQRHIQELEDQLKPSTSPSSSVSATPSPSPSSSPHIPQIFDTFDPDNISWFKLNHMQRSFVRVNYPESAWRTFTVLLKSKQMSKLDAVDRAGLLDDAFSFALSGEIAVDIPLSMCTYLTNETHPLPWATALRHLRHLSSLGYEEPWIEQLSLFALSFIEPAIFANNLIPSSKPDWKPHSLTSLLLEAAVDFKSVSVTAELTGLFPGGLASLTTSVALASVTQFLKQVHPDIRAAVLKAIVASGAPGAFEAVVVVLKHSILPSDRRHALRALSMSKTHHERIRLLNMAIEATEITSYEALMVFEQMAHNHDGRSTAWRKVRDNWLVLQQRYVHGDVDQGRLVKAVVSPFTSHNQHQDILEFFDTHNHKGAEVAVASALETVRFNADWIASHSSHLEKFLQEVQISLDAEKEQRDADSAPQPEQPLDVNYEDKDEDLLQLPLRIVSVA